MNEQQAGLDAHGFSSVNREDIDKQDSGDFIAAKPAQAIVVSNLPPNVLIF
jgi:hypothetical protein